MMVLRLLKLRNYQGRLCVLSPDNAHDYQIEHGEKSLFIGISLFLKLGPRTKYILPHSEPYLNWPVEVESNKFQYFVGI